MKYTLNIVKITALLAVIGFTLFASMYLAGCDNGTDPTGTAPTITTTSLPGGTVGTAYNQTLAAAGDAPITWSVEQGSLPNGLTLSTAGVISGTPAAADTYHFTVKATNAEGSGTKPLSITITGGDSMETAIALTENVWADGNIPSGGEQWFSFTATADEQYIHFEHGTFINAYVEVYDSGDSKLIGTNLNSHTPYASQTVTSGSVYFIKVSPYTSDGNNPYGAYKIVFNASDTPPPSTGIDGGDPALPTPHVNDYTISDNLWQTKGNVTTVTVTPKDDKSGGAVTVYYEGTDGTNYEKSANLPSAFGLYAVTFDVAAVTGWNAAFGLFAGNLTITGGDSMETAIALTENVWADGYIALYGVQWFKFTATADEQYIHFEHGTFINAWVEVYDSGGSGVRWINLNSHTPYVSQTVTSGSVYYIRVSPYTSDGGSPYGAYRIAFNSLPLPPDGSVTHLTLNTWADGNIPTSDGDQWFSFTATAETQYLHVSFGTLSYLYVQVYHSEGNSLGGANIYGSTKYTSRTLTVGQTYYVKVTPLNYSNGTYKIAFNASIAPPPGAIPLTANTWADGNIPSGGEQWFSFTATAYEQYIHFEPGALNGIHVQVYNSEGNSLGGANIYGSTKSASMTSMRWQTYYVKVTPYYSSGSGTYRIGFTTSSTAPAITTLPTTGVTHLTLNTWADGNIPTSNGEQWFSFTATADTQYIHFGPGTLSSLYVQVYNSEGTEVGSRANLYGSTKSTSRTLTVGQTYYVQVTPYSSSNSGTYRIAFNASDTPPPMKFPPVSSTQLTLNTWADGNIPTSGGEQWFSFTATAATQYLHVSFGTLADLRDLYVEVYNSTGTEVGSRANLYGSTKSTSRTLMVGQTYYVKVTPYSLFSSSGTYRIAFNASDTPPPSITLPTTGVTTLTLNTWADGNIPTSSGEQWFRFTATAATQCIHFEPGTLSSVYVEVYNSTGTDVGIQTRLYGSTKYTARTLMVGQTYYVRVTSYDSYYSGAYRIAFTASFLLPGTSVTQLTLNTWADGIPTSDGEQWFSFTATAATQCIHSWPAAVPLDIYVRVYDSAGTEVGSQTRLDGYTTVTSRTLTVGQTYYIKVTPYDSSYRNARIAFNSLPIPPGKSETQLTLNTWADGAIAEGSEQWFRFTATAATQYIRFEPGALSTVYVRVYDSAGTTVGSQTTLGNTRVTSRTLTVGQTYYVKIEPYYPHNSGAYRIMFNTLPIPPGASVTALTLNTWADGNIPTGGGEQWFSFTAIAATQYLHVSFGTLTDLYVQVYNSEGTEVGSRINLYGSTKYTSRALTVGQTYYVGVTPYSSSNSGTYRIAFNTSTTPPN